MIVRPPKHRHVARKLAMGFFALETKVKVFAEEADSTPEANNIHINHAVVPEPRAAMIGMIGALALLRRRRS